VNARAGEVWEADGEGLLIIMWEEVYNDLDIVAFLKVETNRIVYLPWYVLHANELRQKQGDTDLAWRRVA